MIGEATARNAAQESAKQQNYREKHAIRLRDPESGLYLHMSGEFGVVTKDHSWSGYRHQASRLKAQAEGSGQPWPYGPVSLDGDAL